jgi:hypothetical protein
MTDNLLQAIREHKAELVHLLRGQSVAEAFRRYVADVSDAARQSLSEGALLSRFNLWLEAHGERPTTLPVLRQVVGMPTPRDETPAAYIKRCNTCGGTDWGPSGRCAAGGCEVWHCVTCAGWRPDEVERRQRVENGEAVVANLKRDFRLIDWAKAQGLYVYIGRDKNGNPGRWGNPFKIGEHGTRDEVCDLHATYLRQDPERMARLEELRGKVLGCHCYPARCHGMELIKALDEQK